MSVFSTKAEKVFILAFFFIALGVPLFFNENTFYVNKISTMLILSIFVMSLDYLVGKTGLISLGHAMLFGDLEKSWEDRSELCIQTRGCWWPGFARRGGAAGAAARS